ncbi:MAG: DUF4424 domain-containing protein [Rubrivivax sp.]|nr:DUF4424 domain-containing protein [Rubrivivax sp.]
MTAFGSLDRTVPAFGNDSSAELATGGLTLVRNDNIEMHAEDLFISVEEIRVSYRFFNKADKDVTVLVAFPMPDITIEDPDAMISVPTDDPENILGFKTMVNAKPVQARVEQRVVAGGLDRTELLRSLGIPLAPHLDSTNEALDHLPQANRMDLVKLGLAEIEEYDVGRGMEKHLRARWTLKTTYFWEQTFAAGATTTIEHRYRPSVGGTAQTAIGIPGVAKQEWYADYRHKYCMDRDFLAAVERARKAANTEFGPPFTEERISYILTSGANWAGPIKDFRLVVDKGAPDSLVSFCANGVKKIGPTRFEWRRTDFIPASDLHILILKRLPLQ